MVVRRTCTRSNTSTSEVIREFHVPPVKASTTDRSEFARIIPNVPVGRCAVVPTGTFTEPVPGSIAFEANEIIGAVRFVLFIPLALILLHLGTLLAIASMQPNPKSGFDPLFVDSFNFRSYFFDSGFFTLRAMRDLALLFLVFAGSVFFKKYAFVKTLAVMVGLPVGLFLVGGRIYWTKIYTDFLTGYNFIAGLTPLIIGILLFSLPWTYFTLKEKEL